MPARNRVMLTLWVATLLGIARLAFGHTFYLLPDEFVIEPNHRIKMHFHIGDGFPVAPQKWWPEHIEDFLLVGLNQKLDVSSIVVGNPLYLQLVIPKEGSYVFAYTSKPQSLTSKPEVFKKYLEEEGLTQMLALRNRLKQDDKEGREKYTRYTKVLVQVGKIYDKTLQDVVGQKLELIPEQHPYQLRVGEELSVKVLFEGKPLGNALVSATHTRFEGKEGYAHRGRTSAEGIVKFRLTEAGPWLVRLVHMLPSKNSAEADWESFWGSMTFSAGNAAR